MQFKKLVSQKNEILILVVMFFYFLWSQWGFIANGPQFLHADYAPAVPIVEDFLKGQFSAFHWGMTYGGTPLTAIRALYIGGLRLFGLESQNIIWAHTFFTYAIEPLLFTLSLYFLVRTYFGKIVAIFLSPILFKGFYFMNSQFGNEVYLLYLLIGIGVLIWRKHRPLSIYDEKLSGFEVFFVGCICGLGVYVSRIFLIFLLGGVLIDPSIFNLFKNKQVQKKLVLFVLGLCIGFIPEWIHWGILGQMPPKGLMGRRGVLAATKVAFSLPQAMRDLVTPLFKELSFFTDNNGNRVTPAYWISFLGTLFFLPCFLGTLWNVFNPIYSALFKRKGIQTLGNQPLFWIFLMACLAYSVVQSYTDPTPRYLLPLMPVLVLGMARFIEFILQYMRHSFKGAFAVYSLWVLFFILPTSIAKGEWVSYFIRNNSAETIRQVIKHFKDQDIKAVLSNHYWESNQYTAFSLSEIYFVAEEKVELRPDDGLERLKNEPVIGFLFYTPKNEAPRIDRLKTHEFEVKEVRRKFDLQFLAEVVKINGDRLELYLGKAVSFNRHKNSP